MFVLVTCKTCRELNSLVQKRRLIKKKQLRPIVELWIINCFKIHIFNNIKFIKHSITLFLSEHAWSSNNLVIIKSVVNEKELYYYKQHMLLYADNKPSVLAIRWRHVFTSIMRAEIFTA